MLDKPIGGGSGQPMPTYLTVRDYANRIGVHPRTVLRWIAKGDLPAERYGRGIRIKVEDAFAMGRKIKGAK